MARAPHRIRRQVWRVRAPSQADAFALRGELRAAWEDTLLPALEQAFDQAAPDDRVIRIPRLELRLRLGSAGALAEELPRLIREAAAVELAVLRRGGVPEVWEADAGGASSPEEDRRGTLLHYLRTGTLPWAASGAVVDEVARSLRIAFRAEGMRWVDALAAAPDPRAFAFRLLQMLEDADAPAWIAALPPRVPARWRRVLLRLLAPAAAASPPPRTEAAEAEPGRGGDAHRVDDAEPTPAPRHTRLALAAALLAEALTRPVDDTPQGLAAASSRASGGDPGGAIALLLASLPEMAPAREAARSPRREGGKRGEASRGAADRDGALEDAQEAVPGGTGVGSTTAGGPGATVTTATAAAAAAAAKGSAAEGSTGATAAPSAKTPAREGEAAGEPFGVAVANAGLILLHPFIAMLMERTGLREGDAIPKHALPHAAALLHFLATGRDDVQEWELGLAKVLLGLEPDATLLVAEGLLRPEDREECQGVLLSAIAHWTVLKNSSPALLRETFLRRGGLLHRGGQGWLLRVEPASFDVLLGQLPWGIGLVKLPWMTHPIYTEWTTP
ncbi:MAG TPA: contractile injection system tape measure protein [Longimicrobium sp.]